MSTVIVAHVATILNDHLSLCQRVHLTNVEALNVGILRQGGMPQTGKILLDLAGEYYAAAPRECGWLIEELLFPSGDTTESNLTRLCFCSTGPGVIPIEIL